MAKSQRVRALRALQRDSRELRPRGPLRNDSARKLTSRAVQPICSSVARAATAVAERKHRARAHVLRHATRCRIRARTADAVCGRSAQTRHKVAVGTWRLRRATAGPRAHRRQLVTLTAPGGASVVNGMAAQARLTAQSWHAGFAYARAEGKSVKVRLQPALTASPRGPVSLPLAENAHRPSPRAALVVDGAAARAASLVF